MRQSNGKWYVRFVVDGVEYSEPTGLEATERNRKKALQMEAAAKQLVIEGKQHYLRIQAMPFSEAATQFLSWAEGEYSGEQRRSYLRIKSSFSYIQYFFGKGLVSAITEGHIEDFKSARRKIGIAEVSLRHDLHNLSLFFQYAVKKHWARENLVSKVEIPSDADAVRMNILSAAQECLYFDTCRWMAKAAKFIPSPDQKAYWDLYDFGRLMIQQGCRPEEFLELRKDDVDLMNRWLHIRTGKTKAARRRLKLTAESVDVLKRRTLAPGPFVFPAPADPRKHRTTFQRSHDSVLEAMEGKPNAVKFVHYDLRHTFATRLCTGAGVDLATAASILGHGNLRTIQKYVHPTTDSMDAAMLKYSEFSFAGFLPHTPGKEGEQTAIPVKLMKGSNQR